MKLETLDDLIGKTRYLLGYMVQSTNCTDAMFKSFSHKKDVMAYLNKNDVAGMGDISLLHGTITKAVSIPDDINNNMDIFLLVPYSNIDMDSIIIQCSSLEYLQSVVQALITQTTGESEDLDEIIDDIVDIDEQSIDELYVMYGYEIELRYSFDHDGIDDEIVEESKKIFKKIEAQQ